MFESPLPDIKAAVRKTGRRFFSESGSEIVVPLRRYRRIIAVLDIDSRELATFDEADAQWLEKILQVV